MAFRFRKLLFGASLVVCSSSTQPAFAACTALSNGVVPFVRFNSANNATYFSESTTTATATIEGAIAYDTTNDLLKVCDGTNWQSLGGGGGGSGQWVDGTAGAIYYNGGNVGIGTAAPAAKLDITQAGGTSNYLLVGNGIANQEVFGIDDWGRATLHRELQIDASNGVWGNIADVRFGVKAVTGQTGNIIEVNTAAGTGGDIFVTRANGNVGIGTSTPNQGKVEVKGGTVCVDTDSDDNATSCIANESDIRLKKNIDVIPHALDTLVKLRGVLFDWRWDEFPVIADYKAIGRDAGVIAQEVETAFPQGMGEELNGFKTVRYERLVPLLIESVKELKAANDNLKAQRDTMAASHNAEIEALRQEIRAK